MTAPNFNDTPQSKIGNMGAMFIKTRLAKMSVVLLPPPVVYNNGGSPVDQTLQLLDGRKVYAEYITRRQKRYRGFQTFSVDVDKWERINALSAKDNAEIFLFVADISKDFIPAVKDSPCIWTASLSELKKKVKFDKVTFPAKNDAEVWENGQYRQKKFVFLPIEKFRKSDLLTEQERKMIKPLFEEMDRQTPRNEFSTTTAQRQETWAKDTLASENALGNDDEAGTVTVLEEILSSSAEPKIMEIGHRHKVYELKTPINVFPLKFAKDNPNNWIISMTSVAATVRNRLI